MKLAIFINGYATVGKDEVVKAMTEIMQNVQFPVTAVSSIDPIRNMLRAAGYPVDSKTDAIRALMAEVGDAFEKYDGASQYAAGVAIAYLEAHRQGAAFIHVREAAIIRKIIHMLPGDYTPIKVLVTRPGIEAVTSNAADMGVHNTKYNYQIDNDGDLTDLRVKCATLFSVWENRYNI